VLLLMSSTDALVAQQRVLVRRLLVGVAVALLLVVTTAIFLIRNARRTATLTERLQHLDRLLHSEKLATAGQLAAGIAHEIGTPLNVARGRAELTLARIGRDHPQSHSQQIIMDQVDHVIALIQQLLDYVKPQPAAVRRVDVGAAIGQVGELLAPQAAARRVSLRIDASHASFVRTDPGQLQQVLVNLTMNAIDACEPGGHVTLAVASSAGAAVIEVTDDGHGIPPDQRALVFDPFYTTKKRGQGTGLGLWVVAQLARVHAAEVDIATPPTGTGTRVRVVWPAAPAPPAEEDAA
jgi:signal transduction histidine kinase